MLTGRPRKGQERGATAALNQRHTPEDLARWRAAAASLGVTLTEYTRLALDAMGEYLGVE